MPGKDWNEYLKELEREKKLSENYGLQIEEMLEDPKCRKFYELIKKKATLDSVISEKDANLDFTRTQLCDHIIIRYEGRDDYEHRCIRPGCMLHGPNEIFVNPSESDRQFMQEYKRLEENGELYRQLFGYIEIDYAMKLYRRAIKYIGEGKSSHEIMAKMNELRMNDKKRCALQREKQKNTL